MSSSHYSSRVRDLLSAPTPFIADPAPALSTRLAMRVAARPNPPASTRLPAPSRPAPAPTRQPVRSRPAPPPARSRPTLPATRARPAARPAPAAPALLRGNLGLAISVSKVDTRKQCGMCSRQFPHSAALAEHMGRSHFGGLSGINIVSKNSGPELNISKPAKASPVRPQPSRPQAAKVQPTRPQVTRPSKPQPARAPQDPVVKCKTCSKSILQSKLGIHKLSHAQQRRDEKTKQRLLASKPKQVKPNPTTETKPVVEDIQFVSTAETTDQDPVVTDIQNEVNQMQTMELLDNLVNFLQE